MTTTPQEILRRYSRLRDAEEKPVPLRNVTGEPGQERPEPINRDAMGLRERWKARPACAWGCGSGHASEPPEYLVGNHGEGNDVPLGVLG